MDRIANIVYIIASILWFFLMFAIFYPNIKHCEYRFPNCIINSTEVIYKNNTIGYTGNVNFEYTMEKFTNNTNIVKSNYKEIFGTDFIEAAKFVSKYEGAKIDCCYDQNNHFNVIPVIDDNDALITALIVVGGISLFIVVLCLCCCLYSFKDLSTVQPRPK